MMRALCISSYSSNALLRCFTCHLSAERPRETGRVLPLLEEKEVASGRTFIVQDRGVERGPVNAVNEHDDVLLGQGPARPFKGPALAAPPKWRSRELIQQGSSAHNEMTSRCAPSRPLRQRDGWRSCAPPWRASCPPLHLPQ